LSALCFKRTKESVFRMAGADEKNAYTVVLYTQTCTSVCTKLYMSSNLCDIVCVYDERSTLSSLCMIGIILKGI
jgi:hypothetical protein